MAYFPKFKFIYSRHVPDFRIRLFVFAVSLSKCKTYEMFIGYIILYRNTAETAIRGVLWKKVFSEIAQNSKENTFARVSFLIKLQASSLSTQLYLLFQVSSQELHQLLYFISLYKYVLVEKCIPTYEKLTF